VTHKDQQFLEQLVKAIVRQPDQVRTERTTDEMGTLILLHVAKDDMGIVIGKRGTTSNAIKLLVKLVGFNNDSRVAVKIEEPE
jgi:uncharacterized protein